jgi:hypothetical protein
VSLISTACIPAYTQNYTNNESLVGLQIPSKYLRIIRKAVDHLEKKGYKVDQYDATVNRYEKEITIYFAYRSTRDGLNMAPGVFDCANNGRSPCVLVSFSIETEEIIEVR